ncbi:MAG: ubiquitin-like protein, partial [Ruminococcus sp.]
GKFTGTPDINTTYYVPAPAPETFKVYVKKLTGETYTIENLTGETTVAQLKEIIAAQIDIPATAQRLVFSGKTLEDAKTLAEYNIGNESTIHLVPRGYTVTWLNYDNFELDTTTVQYGSTPTYNGETPTKPEDEQNTYTFAGWKNGETTYAPDALPAVSGEVTYTAVYTAEPKIPAPQLPDVIADCTYYDSYWGVYANVPFAVNFSDIKDGAIIFDNYSDTCIMDTKDYSYKFYDQTGTELEAVLTESYDSDGYGYRVIMNVFRFSNPVSGPLYIVATAPAPTYTITWKNYDDSDIGTSTVAEGETPTFSDTIGEIKEKPDNALYTYTFSGWTPDVVAATADATYTATFTATEKSKKLIAGHSLSLDGNIGINFYLDPSVAGLTAQQVTADKLSYTFAWADVETTKAKVNVAEQANQKNFSIETINGVDYIKVTCYVCAAEMTCGVNATFTLNGKTESESEPYTVRKYCDDSVLSENAQYKDDTKLVELVKAMLNYGAMAQTKFKVNTGYLANQNVTYEKGDVTGTMIDTAIAAANGNKTADDMNAVAAALGAKWFSTSLIYLDDSTLRHYFVKDTEAFNPSAYTGNKSNYYYYVEVPGIAAAELDNLQSFTAGSQTFKYSALDFVKGMITSSADGDSQNLAKALYWYNQAANEYFPAPAPAENIVDLSTLQGNYEAQNGDVLTGILSGDKQITIADGATVTLKDADIATNFSADSAGITLLGDATILLEGTNTVMGGYGDCPGIYVPANTTLTIDGDGSLTASGQENGCGIGGGYGYDIAAGNIVINGGTITATGGENAAGIGSGNISSCGNITITGGTITANGGVYAAGIGSGYGATCGNIMIADTVTQVTATKGSDAPNSIGAGQYASCGTKTIAPGANVTQN